ncbi:apiosidase-like domain-containing protein [Fibrella aquatilis]|uniref:DUF4038 domain-containing protein n=1 Tax=Fibrella aquatilis TaxID=2817059 RepID=A0A939K159_9BACT|nr:DUF4038 domain-containing protein [Fibrella aquatilis]MBO0931930.1 DUF4038 domain-containing protein [Fibrella aquatilis]
MKKQLAHSLIALLLVATTALGQSVDFTNRFPLRSSANGHHLVDRQNRPFFYLADTPWTLGYQFTMAEVDDYLRTRQTQRFNVIQIQFLTDQFSYNKTAAGQLALNNTLDLANRNEPFFAHLDSCIRRAADYGMAVMIAPAWLSCCSPGWHQGLRDNGTDKARAFGVFLGQRYHHTRFPNVLGWIHGGDSNPGGEMDELQALAEGIRQTEGTYPRLHTGHWGSPYSTRDQTPQVSWLNLNATYTYDPTRTDLGLYQYQVYAASLRDYQRVPVQPFFLIESHYESPDAADISTGTTAEVLRRQAWWSALSGATGVTYGSANCCGKRADWRTILTMPVAGQMRHLGTLMNQIAWHTLIPDGLPDPAQPDNHRLVVAGFGTFYPYPGPANDVGADYIASAASPDKRLFVCYIPPTGTAQRTFTVDLRGFPRIRHARWLNPATGAVSQLLKLTSTRQPLTTPGDNGTGQNDWVLVVE